MCGLAQARTFDTALYHSFINPYTHSDVDGRFYGPDGKVHAATNSTYDCGCLMWQVHAATNSSRTARSFRRVVA